MPNYVADTMGTAMGSLFETIVRQSDIEENEDALNAVVLTGSIQIKDRWFDFGLNVAQTNGQFTATHFVNESDKNTHATLVGDMVSDYFTAAGETLTTWAHCAYPVPLEEEPLSVENTVLVNGTILTKL